MKRPVLLPVCAAVIIAAAAPSAVRAWQFRDSYVMVTVEESSTSALTGWPLLPERMSGHFVDAQSRSVSLGQKPSMLGVSLCVEYSATSQGIEIAESLDFSRTGKARLPLDRPLSYITSDMEGGQLELIDNDRRVVAGPLLVDSVSQDGTVTLHYCDKSFQLAPGETWAELLALTTDGLVPIDPANWDDEYFSYLEQGYPMTRLAVVNRGLWPKSGIAEEPEP